MSIMVSRISSVDTVTVANVISASPVTAIIRNMVSVTEDQYQLSCAIMSSHQDMLSSRNYHYTTDSSLVALVLTQIRLRVVPMA